MKKWLLSLLLLFTSLLAHAQVGPCPPGMSQYPGRDGIPSCGPLRPDYDQPRGHWITQWGALATSDHGTTGWSTGKPDADTAKEAAIKNCVLRGGTGCKAAETYSNGCIAVVNGDMRGYPASDATYNKAVKLAMTSCKKNGDKNCELFRAECSPARWVGN